jgi:hypothetical protein
MSGLASALTDPQAVAMAVPRVMANFEKAAVKKGSVQASGPEVLPPQNETG